MNEFDKKQLVEDIISRVDIVELISEYVSLTRKGKDYWGLCPFHQEDTPSFAVSPDKQVFYCFGCQVGGNAISFLRKKDNLSYYEALSILAERVGISLNTGFDSSARKQLRNEKQKFYRLNELTANFYHDKLFSSEGKVAYEYIKKRGINKESIEKFKLGYASNSWDALLKYLTKMGFSPTDLERYGLVIARLSGGGYYDRFRNRLIFSIFDQMGQVVGFAGRVLGEENPKYLNSPESRFFDKGRVLYGLHLARQSIQSQQQVIIVEGYMDALMCHQYGIKNVIASMGTALTSSQVQLILRYASEQILAFDTDAAGQMATMRAINLIRSLGGRVRVVSFAEEKDPDELIRKRGSEYFLKLVAEAQNFFDYKMHKLLDNHKINNAEGKIKILAEFWDDLKQTNSELERQEYLEKLSIALQVPETIIREEFRKNLSQTRYRRRQLDKNTNIVYNKREKLVSTKLAPELAERHLLRLMLEDPEIFKQVEEEHGLDLFTERKLQQIAKAYREVLNLGKAKESENSFSLACLIENLVEEETRELLLEICLQDSSFPVFTDAQKKKAVNDFLQTIFQHHYQKQLEQLQSELNQAFQKGNCERSRNLAAEMERIKMRSQKNFYLPRKGGGWR